jgi:DNA-binding GntR family transcriptional regulator
MSDAHNAPPSSRATSRQNARPPLLSVRQQASEMLRNAIYEGELKPGQRLTEREICETYGVSRTVAREVVRELEAERLIENDRRNGVTIAKMSEKEIFDLYEMRILLEARACALCAEAMAPELVGTLDDCMRAIETSAASGDHQDQRDSNQRFYDEIFRAAGNIVLRQILTGLHGRVAYLRTMSMSRPGRPEQSLQELKALLAALKAGDGAEAARLSTSHIVAARSSALRGVSERGAA